MKFPFLFFIVCLLLSAGQSHAQTSDYLIITWQAENLYPADFQGRANPTAGSPIKVSIEGVLNGKLANLNTADIAWFLDESLVERGVGIKTIQFTARNNTTNSHFVRAQVKIGNKNLEEQIRIPVKQVELAIEIPVLNKVIPANSEIKISAVPYFFNTESVENLVFNWIINNNRQKQTGNGDLSLKVGQPQNESQSKMTITANIQNLLNPLEVAQTRGIFLINQ